MGSPKFQPLSGAVDGVNRIYTAPEAYTPGTAVVFLNGQMIKNSAGDPWVETNPSVGEVELAADCIPNYNDELYLFYIDDVDAPDIVEVCEIQGQIECVSGLTSALSTTSDLTGTIETTSMVYSDISPKCPVEGTIDKLSEIYGDICQCH